jgi:hypothetical protein
MIWCFREVELLVKSFGVIEPCLRLSKALVELCVQKNESNLYPLSEPAVASRRSGFIWIVNVLFGKMLTLSYR